MEKCTVCEKIFKNVGSLMRHNKNVHSTPELYNCKICSKAYQSTYALDKHAFKEHGVGERKMFKCDICYFTTHVKFCLQQHLDTKHETTKLSCDICSKVSKNKRSLMWHVRRSHSTVKRKYNCDKCPKLEYTSERGLNYHMKTIHSDKPLPIEKCEKCDYKCKFVYQLNKHKRKHLQKKLYSCDICDFKCNQMYELKKHGRVHFGEKEKCQICGEYFKILEQHMTHNHDENKMVKCDICGSTQRNKQSLLAHIKCVHAQKKDNTAQSVQCEICEVEVIDISGHMKHIHGENDTVQCCEICGIAFKSQKSILKHIKIEHTSSE